MNKKKLLAYCDSPDGITGFGRVARHVLKALSANYDITICARCEHIPYRKVENYEIYADPYNQITAKLLKSGEFQAFWSLNNLGVHTELIAFLINQNVDLNLFKWIAYIPVEQDYLCPFQVEGLDKVDHIVAYHEDAEKILLDIKPELEGKTSYIYHGTDTETFYPVSEEQRLEYRGMFDLGKDNFLISSIGYNQWRKDHPLTILAFLLYQLEHDDPNCKLYIHTPHVVGESNIKMQIESIRYYLKSVYGKLPPRDRIILTLDNFNGYSDEQMNAIYNMSDAIISTSVGEGWGFSATEAFATKTPFMGLDNTSTKLLMSKGGGINMGGGDIDTAMIFIGNTNLVRNRGYVTSIVDAIHDLRSGKLDMDLSDMTQAGYDFVKKYTWDYVCDQWVKLFKEIDNE